MQIVVISPEGADPREAKALEGLFTEGLERYHVRKPSWNEAELESWILRLPAAYRPRLFLHQHPRLVGKWGLGGAHEKDGADANGPRAPSRSCHSLAALRQNLGLYRQILFGPVFPSLSKPGYGPQEAFPWQELKSLLLADRGPARCRIWAIGGITSERLGRCRELGFDGAAVLGAVWQSQDPVRAFAQIRKAAQEQEPKRDAA